MENDEQEKVQEDTLEKTEEARNVLVYRYGAAPRMLSGDDLVRRQIRLNHEYRNALVVVERRRRDALRSLLSLGGDARKYEEAVTVAKREEEAAASAVAAARKGKLPKEELLALRAVLVKARETQRTAAYDLRQLHRKMRENAELIVRQDQINNDAALAARRLAREEFSKRGLYWGTYQLAEDADNAARRSMPLFADSEPNDPSFVPFRGEGNVSVQIQKGIPVENVFSGTDTQVQVEPVDEKAWHSTSRSERRRFCKTVLRLRVGSDEKRKPIWAEWRIAMHRPIPPGSIVKRVTASLRRHSVQEEWWIQFTVELPAGTPKRARTGQAGTVAVSIGWQAMGDEIRTATWVDDTGRFGELRLTPRELYPLRKPSELRGLRSKMFLEARTALVEALKKIPATTVPQWFLDRTMQLWQWQSENRLYALHQEWDAQPFPGDAAPRGALRVWARQEQHLWTWEQSLRTSSLRNRKEVYRIFASKLAKEYKTLLLSEIGLVEIIRSASLEEKTENPNTVWRTNRMLVAPGELQGVLMNAFAGDVAVLPKVDVKDTGGRIVLTCHACRSDEEFDETAIVRLCSKCHAIWDQDINACRNLLARHAAATGPAGATAEARKESQKEEARWVRAARLSKEKYERGKQARLGAKS